MTPEVIWQFESGEPRPCPVEAYGTARGTRCALISPSPMDKSSIDWVFEDWGRWCVAQVSWQWEAPPLVDAYLETGECCGTVYNLMCLLTARKERKFDERHAQVNGDPTQLQALEQARSALSAAKIYITVRRSCLPDPRRDAFMAYSSMLHALASRDIANATLRWFYDCLSPHNIPEVRRPLPPVPEWAKTLVSKHTARLRQLFIEHTAPLPNVLAARLEQDRDDRHTQTPLRTLRLGQWWLDGGEGLEFVDV